MTPRAGRRRVLPAAAVAVALATGVALCTPPTAAAQVGSLQRIQYGEVVSAEKIEIEQARTGQSAAVGSSVGSVAGAVLAERGNGWVGSLVGGLIGGAIGHAADKKRKYKPGWELIIRLESGEEVATQVLRKAGDFREGDRVRLVIGQRGTQVTKVK